MGCHNYEFLQIVLSKVARDLNSLDILTTLIVELTNVFTDSYTGQGQRFAVTVVTKNKTKYLHTRIKIYKVWKIQIHWHSFFFVKILGCCCNAAGMFSGWFCNEFGMLLECVAYHLLAQTSFNFVTQLSFHKVRCMSEFESVGECIFRAIGLCPNGNHVSMQADWNLPIFRTGGSVRNVQKRQCLLGAARRPNKRNAWQEVMAGNGVVWWGVASGRYQKMGCRY